MPGWSTKSLSSTRLYLEVKLEVSGNCSISGGLHGNSSNIEEPRGFWTIPLEVAAKATAKVALLHRPRPSFPSSLPPPARVPTGPAATPPAPCVPGPSRLRAPKCTSQVARPAATPPEGAGFSKHCNF